LKATEHDKYENIAGSVWLNLLMGSNGNAYYCPRRPAPGWAQLNIYTKVYIVNYFSSLPELCFLA
jgi:hypothetical protein